MTNILIHGYYYRYKQERNLIKDLVNAENYLDAQNRINAVIAEHDNYINSRGIPNDGNSFTSNDNLSLKHGRDHLESTQEAEAEEQIATVEQQKQATIDALDEQY